MVGRILEPLFVGVVGGTRAERRAFVQRLELSLRSFGVRAGLVEGGEPGLSPSPAPGARPPFWENEVVLVDGLAAGTVPRITLSARAAEGGSGGDLATVQASHDVPAAEVERVARLVLRRCSGSEEVASRERGLSS